MTLRTLWLTAALLAPACGFTAPASGDDSTGPGGPGGPGSPGSPAARHCDTSDSSLRLCIDFDDQQALTGDGSSFHHDATESGISVMPRDQEQAALLSTASRVRVPETADLDITSNLTVSLWARPDAHPSTGAFWALDNNKQYAISYQPTGTFRCGLGPDTVDTAIWFDPGYWHFIACTFDQQAKMLKISVDGTTAGCRTVDHAIATNGNEGTAIGANINAGPTFSEQFVGGLDDIQVFARTFTTSQICDASGADYCYSPCPLGQGD